MKASVQWCQDRLFLGKSGSGHAVVMDGPPEAGGQNLGVRPMEMLLLGMGGCASFDVVSILEKMQQPITGCVAELQAERADSEPKVFTRINIHFKISGAVDAAKAERAVKLSAEKYCSASIMLGKVAEITHSFELVSG
ncbi:MAG: peroxiredoxin [Thiotrichales bacterium 16-46-22]|nr:MAG: peroxiredoxin [Thiotrichales bacterium 16-46-22]HQT01774.1 OsmC family protein [Thiotrichales bacterium]